MSKKLKIYVIIISRYFPGTHPRKTEETDFLKSIYAGLKKHTIRGNYKLWKKRITEVNAGRAILSLRYWSGKPFRSKQIEFRKITKAGIQKIDISRFTTEDLLICTDNKAFCKTTRFFNDDEMNELADHDGLTYNDFRSWFFPKKLKPNEMEIFTGAIIHFTDLRY